jgi:peroxiredoxin
MAHDLTGDFDVVVEFAIGAVDRVLAAMHSSGRFLHSMSARVDDNPPPGPKVPRPVVLGSVDRFGDATVDHSLLRALTPLAGSAAAAAAGIASMPDPVVNPDLLASFDPPIVPSHLQGRAQLQLSPPAIDVPDASGAHVRVRMQTMARYFPDPHTAPLVPFLRGELQITAPVSLFSSNAARLVEIDIRSDQVVTNFNLLWPGALGPEDLAAISLLIRNALQTSFLPSNQPQLPDRIGSLQVKTLVGGQNALALLLNMRPLLPGGSGSPPGHSGTVQNVFLAAGDDFAFAVGSDYVQAAFPNVTDHRFPSVAGYTFSVQGPTIQFQSDRLLLVGNGHAHNPHLPDFDFTVKQALTLNLVATTAAGPRNTAELVPVGDISLEINGVPDFVVNAFDGDAKKALRQKRDSSLADINRSVRDALDVDKNLAAFLRSLLDTRDQPGLNLTLAYTSVQIAPSGIVLHGSLSMDDWPAAHVEFEQIPMHTGGRLGGGADIAKGPDYSALNTWIPGGTVQRYEWSSQGQALYIDENRFVWRRSGPGSIAEASARLASTTAVSGITTSPPVVSTDAASTPVLGYSSLCLTVTGVRVSASGPAVLQPVSASVCDLPWFPVINSPQQSAPKGALPSVALTRPGVGGLIEITGHTMAAAAEPGSSAPNRIVHFADDRTASSLGFLLDALSDSKRGDAATAILAVLTPNQLSRARHTAGVIYAENEGGAWDRAFGVKAARRPLTLIVAPDGNVAWKHEGSLHRGILAPALAKYLIQTGPIKQKLLRMSLRIGQPAPNFLFELAPGRGLTLRKAAGRPAILVFWRSTTRPSIEAVRDLQDIAGTAGASGPLLFAINDGEAAELARKVAAENGLTATIVTDPQRNISLAYGVTIWPTVIFLDASGSVRTIRYGRFAGELVASPAQGTAGAR